MILDASDRVVGAEWYFLAQQAGCVELGCYYIVSPRNVIYRLNSTYSSLVDHLFSEVFHQIPEKIGKDSTGLDKMAHFFMNEYIGWVQVM